MLSWNLARLAGAARWLQEIDRHAAAHRAVALLAVTGVTLGAALLAARLPAARRGANWRAFVLGAGLNATLLLTAAYLLVSVYAVAWRGVAALPARFAAARALGAVHPLLDVEAIRAGDPVGRLGAAARYVAPSHVVERLTMGSVGSVAGALADWRDPRAWPDAALLAGWAALCAASAARQAASRWAVRRIRRRAQPVTDGALRERFDALRRASGLRRAPALGLSDAIDSPFATGLLRPAVVLPASYPAALTTAEMDAVLLHECAHLARRDPLALLAADALCALLWFQPLAWTLRRALIDAAEDACDAAVTGALAPSARPLYAALLLRVAEQRLRPATERVAGIGLAPERGRAAISRRVEAILHASPVAPLGGAQRWAANGASAALIALLLAACVVGPSEAVDQSSSAAPALPGAERIDLGAFAYARSQGWSIAPAVPAAAPDATQAALAVARLRKLIDAVPYSPQQAATVRRLLLASLRQHPHSYQIESELANWYSPMNDLSAKPTSALPWVRRALADAPEIVAQQVRFADGRPVPGYRFIPSLSFYAGAMFGLDPNSFQLYGYVTTDAHGCYYLPTERAAITYGPSTGFYEASLQPTPQARAAAKMSLINTLGSPEWFAATSRVAVLPPLIAQPYLVLTVTAPGVATKTITAAVQNHDAVVGAYRGGMLHVAWPAAIGAARYKVSLIGCTLSGGKYPIAYLQGLKPIIDPATGKPVDLPASAATQFTTPPSLRALLVPGRTYEMMVFGLDAAGQQIAESQYFVFKVAS